MEKIGGINPCARLCSIVCALNVSYHIRPVCFSILANLVLHRTIERIHVGKKYGDIPRGIFVVRGENVVLLGEVVSERSTARRSGDFSSCCSVK